MTYYLKRQSGTTFRYGGKSLSILFLQRGPKRLTAQMTEAELRAHNPRIVNNQPLPMAAISGAPAIAPIHENMLRTKLFTATPELDFFGMSSVKTVVAIANIIMLPSP